MFKIDNIYNFQNLPVPDKVSTLEKFLAWVEPLVSKKDLDEAKKMVEKYCLSPESDKLHEVLLKRAEDKNSSWLIDWWIKYSYLVTRGPVTPENNAPMVFTSPNLNQYDVSGIISIIAFAIAQVYLELKQNNNLINDQQFTPKKAYSLDQLIYLLASIREPNINVDTYYSNDNTSDFFIIYKNNVAYKVKLINNNKVIDINDLYTTVNTIVNSNASIDYGFNLISACTNRDEAKQILDDLLKDKVNLASYQDIKDAIFIMCYDDVKSTNPNEVINNFINPDKFNKFHGKSFLINVDDNKNVVMCADHTKVDGGTEIYLMARISQVFDQNLTLNINKNSNQDYSVLNFNLNDTQLHQLKKIRQDFNQYCHRAKAIYLETNKINKIWTKSHNILSADGFIQLLFQIAQYKTNQKFNNTYVAVDTRNFFKGRTECIRPISNASKQFAIDFVENRITSKQEAMKRLEEIFNIHYERSKACQAGLGINRYMLGLVLAYEENKELFKFEKPKLFDCEAWKIICQNVLSTSSIVSPNIDWVYFDPVHIDGIGIFYAMKNDTTHFAISYWVKDHDYGVNFANNLEWAIDKLYSLLN